MTYSFSLFSVGVVVGVLLLLGHLPAILAPGRVGVFLRGFPRSDFWGLTLLILAGLWSFYLVRTIDLGEFDALRNMMSLGVVVAVGLTGVFVREFLAIRALSILGLLAAEILLCAAFLQPPLARLWLVFLAYGWILGGLFGVGLPWLGRDIITWVTAASWRVRALGLLGLAYGAIILYYSFAAFR